MTAPDPAPDLHPAVLAALDAGQAQLDAASPRPWGTQGGRILPPNTELGRLPSGARKSVAVTRRATDAEFIAATANRAQQMIDLRREIAERHAPDPESVYCAYCDDGCGCGLLWPCPDYLSVARATLPADALARYRSAV